LERMLHQGVSGTSHVKTFTGVVLMSRRWWKEGAESYTTTDKQTGWEMKARERRAADKVLTYLLHGAESFSRS